MGLVVAVSRLLSKYLIWNGKDSQMPSYRHNGDSFVCCRLTRPIVSSQDRNFQVGNVFSERGYATLYFEPFTGRGPGVGHEYSRLVERLKSSAN